MISGIASEQSENQYNLFANVDNASILNRSRRYYWKQNEC
jgi:hypothetical protein